jgi:polyisoprenoid-binding protein YceI
MLDSVHSTVEITLGSLVAALPPLGGVATRPSRGWAGATLTLVLDPTGVETGDAGTSADLRSPALFDAGNHPISLRGNISLGTSGDELRIAG